MPIFSELKRRKVIQTGIVYVAVAWLAVQVADTLVPIFGGDEALLRVFVVALAIGFPVALVVSWYFDWSPKGLERDPADIEPSPEPADPASGTEPRRLVEDLSSIAPIPAPPNQLVGREADLVALSELLEGDCRLVTLTGPGGSGKTRLAAAAADRASDSFRNGAVYVDLTPVIKEEMVLPTVAQALGVKEAESRTLEEGLEVLLADLRVLLVLDNFEQVIEAAPAIATLLGKAPGLRIIATSRIPLRVGNEAEYPVQPLPLPPEDGDMADLDAWPATRLFLQRAKQSRPDFRVGPDDRKTLVEICRRLDGLPLALELAAARVRALDLKTILDRLEKSLDFLRGGGRDLPPRQRALRATIDWSHSLLDEAERKVFRRLGIFSGGFSSDAVIEVAGDGEADTLEILESLVEKGLVRPPDAANRYGIFETLREFAIERLADEGEVDATRARHAMFYAAYAERINDGVGGQRQEEWYRKGLAEEANLHSALDYLIARARAGDDEALEAGLLACGQLWFYWHIRNLHLTSREYAHILLDIADTRPEAGTQRARLWCSTTASIGAWIMGRYEESEDLASRFWPCEDAEPVLDLSIRIMIGLAYLPRGRLDEALERLSAVCELADSAAPSPWAISAGYGFKGMTLLAMGEVDEARAAFERSCDAARPGEHLGYGLGLSGLAAIATLEGDHARSSELWEESVAQYGAVDDRGEQARVYEGFAWSVLAEGKPSRARELFFECLRAFEDVGSLRGVGIALMGLAAAEAHLGDAVRAVTIEAAALRYSEEEGIVNNFGELPTVATHALETARAGLDRATLDRCRTEGAGMSVREASRYAMQQVAVEA